MKFKLAFLIIIFQSIFSFFTDYDPFIELLKKFDDYTSRYPQEKIHLHIDNTYYMAGEDVWFKAYVLNTKSEGPSLISNFLYVELINENDSLIYRHKYALTTGLSWGDFQLSKSLAAGSYRIRAYTLYMRNFSRDFFFEKKIYIANTFTGNVITQTQFVTKKDSGKDLQVANIHFEDKGGIPYADNRLSYAVTFGDHTLVKDNTKTSLQGDINISWANTSISKNTSGRIIIYFELPGNQIEIKSIPIKITSDSVDVQFMPEGGRLVEGVTQRIGIKAVNKLGLGEMAQGIITDNEGNTLARFITNSLGMGSFNLKTVSTKIYTAKISFGNGYKTEVKLPKADKNGYVMSVNNLDTTEIKIKITASDSLIKKGEIKVVAQHGGNIDYIAKASLDRNVFTASVPRNKFHNGIIQFILFSPDNIPSAERLIFNQKEEDFINLKVTPSKIKKGKNNIAFQALLRQKPVIGSFSVAITRIDSCNEERENSIFASLLLTSDLAGDIENPNHYFLNNDLKTKTDLDNLMLTQGWRRFNWTEIISNTTPSITFLPEQNIKITGTVTKKGKPIEAVELTLMSTKNSLLLYKATSDSFGRFIFDSLDFTDSTKFILQPKGKEEAKNYEIHIDTLPLISLQSNKKITLLEANSTSLLMKYIKNNDHYQKQMARLGIAEHGIDLKEITVTQSKKSTRFSQNLNGPGNADYVITAEQIKGNTSLLSSIVRYAPIGPNLIFNGGYYLDTPKPALLILDGAEIDPSQLADISMEDVASVELLKYPGKTGVYGQYATQHGAIVITTWPPGSNPNKKQSSSGMTVYNPLGISIPRIFYLPKFEREKISGLTTTVYWNPQLLTNDNGKTNFDFYANSEKDNYRILIEGIDTAGHSGRTVLNMR